MDWSSIISGAIGAIVGGIVTGSIAWVLVIKEKKASAKTDVVDKSADAMNKVLELLDQQQEASNNLIKRKDEIIDQQSKLIEGFKVALDEAEYEIKSFKYKIKENERRIAGMQKIIDNQIKGRQLAEDNICFVSDCEIRRPKKGTYKPEDNG